MVDLRTGQMDLCCTTTDILTINQEHRSGDSYEWRDCQCDKDCDASHLQFSQTSSRRPLTLLTHWMGVIQEKPGFILHVLLRCDNRGSHSRVFWHIPFGCQQDVVNATMVDVHL